MIKLRPSVIVTLQRTLEVTISPPYGVMPQSPYGFGHEPQNVSKLS
jgi:hypothetical protein